jgi:peptidoglycan/xylan/chitin deacetylase (PgdA/CDA1 family)
MTENIIKEKIKSAITKCRILKLINVFTKKGVTILRYHAVQDIPDKTDATIGAHIMHPTNNFRKQMEILAKDYDPITMDDLVDYVDGKIDMSNRAVVITFDDGYTDNYEVAAPIMKEHGIPGTFYITVNTIGNKTIPWFIRTRYAFWTTPLKEWTMPSDGVRFKLEKRDDRVVAMRSLNNHCVRLTGKEQDKFITQIEKALGIESPLTTNNFMMSWEQVADLKEQGHIIGSHTLTHPNLAKISKDEMRYEIVDSKRIIDQKLDTDTIHFSYPNPGLSPQWDEETTQAVNDAGYKTAVLSRHGAVYVNDNLFTLNRAAVPSELDDFEWNLDWTLIGREL